MRKLYVSELNLDMQNYSRPEYLARPEPHPNRNKEIIRNALKTLRDRKDFLVRVSTANPTIRIVKPKKVSLGPRLAVEIGRVDQSDTSREKSMKEEVRHIRKTSAAPRNGQYVSNPINAALADRVCDQVLLKNSNKLRLIHLCKRKRFQTVLVLCAEFLINESNFWKV